MRCGVMRVRAGLSSSASGRKASIYTHTVGIPIDSMARDVTHGHMANGSASGQEDRIDAIIFEHLRPLRRALLHQTRNVGQPVIGVAALRQGADHSLLGQFAQACQREDHVDILLGRADVVGHMPDAQACFRCLYRDDAQRREALCRLAHIAHRLLVG
jgi:hypothetical protein